MFTITKILVIGSNTRSVSKSLYELGYTVYATSFFYLLDQLKYVEKLLVPENVLDMDVKSLEDIALDYVNEVDYIICTGDININRFPKSKILGNHNTNQINNKYKLYKKLHKNFLMPETYRLDSIDEASEIVKSNEDKKYVIKPIYGTGGIGIKWFNHDLEMDTPFLLQEYISGEPVSSSFLSYKNQEISFITTSEQVIGSGSLGASDFLYCGNITPYIQPNTKIYNISSKISKMYNLIGSNGIDFVIHNKNVYVIEVNPRILGTFECIEKSFNINMAQAHLNSCNDIDVDVPKVEKFTVKLIPYSFSDNYYNLSNLSNVYDISDSNYLIKKGYPISTIVTSDRILENAMIKAELLKKQVYSSIKKEY